MREGIAIRRWHALLAVVAVGALGAGWLLLGGSEPDGIETRSAEKAELPGLPWEAEPAKTTAPTPLRLKEKNGVTVGGPQAMPPASAGSNGAYSRPRPTCASSSRRSGIPLDPPRTPRCWWATPRSPPSPPRPRSRRRSARRTRSPTSPTAGAAATARGARAAMTARRGQLRARGRRDDQPARHLGRADALGSPGRGRWLTIYANPAMPTRSSRACAGTPSAWAAARAPLASRRRLPSGYVARHIPVCQGMAKGPLARAPSTVFSGRVVPARLISLSRPAQRRSAGPGIHVGIGLGCTRD